MTRKPLEPVLRPCGCRCVKTQRNRHVAARRRYVANQFSARKYVRSHKISFPQRLHLERHGAWGSDRPTGLELADTVRMDRVLEFHALFAWSAYGRPLAIDNFLQDVRRHVWRGSL